MWKTFALFVAVASIAVLATACGGEAVDCTTNPDYATCVAPIFDARCGGGACHGASGTQSGLKLVGVTASDIVGKDAQGSNTGMKWIVAGSADESLIYLKVQDTPDRAKEVQGGRMPIGGTLSAAELTTVKTWIDKGAK